MDWKRHYADELATPAGREAALSALQRHAGGDGAVRAALEGGGVASFPHVGIRDSADPIARVVCSILASGRRHVVALGVLHGGTLPERYRSDWAAMAGAGVPALQAYERLAGAVVATGPAATPFGPVPAGPPPPPANGIREDDALLQGEFSLDLFLALLAAGSALAGVDPPAVTRLYVAATRSPEGDFGMARALAGGIRPLLGPGAVCVATGDLAHVGQGYMPAEQWAALPAGHPALVAEVRAAILAQHASALQGGPAPEREASRAWDLATWWRNDQRHLLPVIAHLVGPQARYELLSLQLSDYAAINGVPAPCWVAAALGVFTTAGDVHGRPA